MNAASITASRKHLQSTPATVDRGDGIFSEEAAIMYWLQRQQSRAEEPFLQVIFGSEAAARAALAELSCLCLDDGEWCCDRQLTYGYYESHGAYVGLLAGEELSRDLFQEARATFERYGAKLRAELVPPTKTPMPPPVAANSIAWVRGYRRRANTYAVYRATCPRAAKLFLSQLQVTRPHHYVIVETAAGNYGKDVDGTYRE